MTNQVGNSLLAQTKTLSKESAKKAGSVDKKHKSIITKSIQEQPGETLKTFISKTDVRELIEEILEPFSR